MPDTTPLDPPPRHVPASLRWRVTLGGALPMVGWLLLAIGGGMANVFVRNSEIVSAVRFSGELATTTGVVTGHRDANVVVNGRRVGAVEFEYEADGKRWSGRSFATGSPAPAGREVVVEYRADSPATARIQGMQAAPLPGFVAFLLAFPLVGLGLVVAGFVRGRRRAQLLADADAAWGLLTERQPTRTRVNNRMVYRLTFTFVDAGGRQRTVNARSHRDEFFRDDVARIVLYDERRSRGDLAELMPGRPEAVDGGWAPASPIAIGLLLLPPTLVAVGLWASSLVTF